MKYNKFSRRMFLQGSGGMALAIPLLPSLLPNAEAQTANSPLLIQIGMTAGLERCFSYPITRSADYRAFGTSGSDRHISSMPLSTIIQKNGQISSLLDPTWNSYASKLNLFTNTHFYDESGGVHNTGSSFAAFVPEHNRDNTMYSLDHRVLRAWKKNGYRAEFDALRADVVPSYYSGFSYSGDAGGNYFISSTAELENEIFAVTKNQNPTTPPTQNPLAKIVDLVFEDYKAIMSSARLSSVDRTRFQEGMDFWNDISNRRVNRTLASQSCNMPNKLPGSGTSPEQEINQAVDILSMALQCGLTRIVSHDITAFLNAYRYLPNTGLVDFIHNAAHYNSVPDKNVDPNGWKNYDYLLKFCGTPTDGQLQPNSFKWRFTFIKRWLDRLSSLKSADGSSLLDKALLVVATEYSRGEHSHYAHNYWAFGDAGGRFNTGLHVNCGGAPVQKVLTTFMHGLGLTTADIEIEGKPNWGQWGDTGDFNVESALASFFPNVSEFEYACFMSNARKGEFQDTQSLRKPIPILT